MVEVLTRCQMKPLGVGTSISNGQQGRTSQGSYHGDIHHLVDQTARL